MIKRYVFILGSVLLLRSAALAIPLTVSLSATNAVNGSPVTLTGKATDTQSRLATMNFYVNGPGMPGWNYVGGKPISGSSATAVFSWTAPSSGNWNSLIRAFDTVGNPDTNGNITAAFTVTDANVPPLTVSLTATNTSLGGSTTFVGRATDVNGNLSSMNFYINGPGYPSWNFVGSSAASGADSTGTFSWSPPASGNWSVLIRAFDSNGAVDSNGNITAGFSVSSAPVDPVVNASNYPTVDAAFAALMSDPSKNVLYFPGSDTPYTLGNDALCSAGVSKSITLKGDSATGSVIIITGGNGFIFNFDSNAKILDIENLQFLHGSTLSSSGCVSINYNNSTAANTPVTLRNVVFKVTGASTMPYAVKLSQLAGADLKNVVFGDYFSLMNLGTGLLVSDNVSRVTIEDCAFIYLIYGVQLAPISGAVSNIVVVRDLFLADLNGVYAKGGPSAPAFSNLTVEETHIDWWGAGPAPAYAYRAIYVANGQQISILRNFIIDDDPTSNAQPVIELATVSSANVVDNGFWIGRSAALYNRASLRFSGPSSIALQGNNFPIFVLDASSNVTFSSIEGNCIGVLGSALAGNPSLYNTKNLIGTQPLR